MFVRVVSRGADVVEWVESRQIRASFKQVTRTLYQIKSNSFPLWNRAAQDMSCPITECPHGV
uniref:Uncharacterized protein n=1 Tax=Peronospora matthiolae TaxID=2874970 RepID=A0AAV1VLR5_9STRA